MTRTDDEWLTVAVAYKGQVAYAKAFGLANAETKDALTLDHVWAPSAISRFYTTTLIAAPRG